MQKLELLAPVGDKERLYTAIHFGCDAVYLAYKQYGLRAFSDNFTEEEMTEAVNYAHLHNVKVYVTVNILAHNQDFLNLIPYLKFLESIKVDGVIVSDLGIMSVIKENTNLEIHVSTQANITNLYSANTFIKFGAKRLVLARELSLKEIKEIKDNIPENIDIETFVHGAMCISYSGRCLLSNYFTHRDSNKGACAQPCRWKYALHFIDDKDNSNQYYPIEEDDRGTYILNSKDLCLIEHIKDLSESGIYSLKVEGRMKSTYYVATVINAYKRAINDYLNNNKPSFNYIEEIKKSSNRDFTTGFYFPLEETVNIETSKLSQTHEFVALVVDENKDDYIVVELRNKFKVGDTLEVLSPDDNFNKIIEIKEIRDENNNLLDEVKKVKQKVYIKSDLKLHPYDILRKRIK